MNPDLQIKPFSIIHQSEARLLILEGLGEHWGWIDEEINEDLLDIAHSYAEGHFVLGWLGSTLVATEALVNESNGVMRIVRMSVKECFRRQRIGSQMLRHLIRTAHSYGAIKVVLETTDTWHDVVEFYRSFGFIEVARKNGEVHMELDL